MEEAQRCNTKHVQCSSGGKAFFCMTVQLWMMNWQRPQSSKCFWKQFFGIHIWPHCCSGCQGFEERRFEIVPSRCCQQNQRLKTKGKLIAVFAGKHFAISSFKAAQDFSVEKGVLDAFHWVKQTAEQKLMKQTWKKRPKWLTMSNCLSSPTPRH